MDAVLEDAAQRAAAPAAVGAVLERLVEARPETGGRLVSDGALTPLGEAVVAVAGASNVLGRLIVADAAALDVLDDLDHEPPWEAPDPAALSRSKRLALLHVAARDLVGLDPLETVGSSLARLGARVLDAALAIATDSETTAGPEAGLAIVGMGKLGGGELNYASDVDILFVSTDEDASALARAVLDIARQAFRVDVDLRPEGRAGALTRTIDSYRSYWRRWASAWEFQALLKARPVAGDAALGDAFAGAVSETLWGRSFSADELAELRAMKARTEALVDRRGMAGRELKRGPGGIRDIEFAVQLLQLVHGRRDDTIRDRSTLGALAELAAAGYVSAEDAEALGAHYRFLRTVEHRLQLVEEEQTHSVPTGMDARRRLARVLGFEDTPEQQGIAAFDDALRRHQSAVRAIHERLFFRPLLEAFAADTPTSEAVERSLAAFGFADAARTRAAVQELAGGLRRSSRLMGQLLPLLLDWLSLTPDPDLGLLGLRNLVVHRHHRSLLVTTFRESPEAARRLCLLLGSSRWLAEALERNPELVAVLDDDDALAPTAGPALVEDALARTGRASDDDTARAQLLRLRQDQLVRIAARDLLGVDEVAATGASLTGLFEGILEASVQFVSSGAPFCIIGMGRFGGAELAYGSDLDVLFVHAEGGEEVADKLLQLMHGPVPAGRVATIDLGLRPEGAQGKLSRDVDGYRLYFSRWAQTWERQALLRARVVAGDRRLGEQFMAAVRAFVWDRPFGDDEVAEIRRIKARVERERIPSREDPQFHLKLGKGSLSDVEWTVQLLQLRHGVTGAATMAALDDLEAAAAIGASDAADLRRSYVFCERTRNRLHLVQALPGGGRGGDSLPAQAHELSRLARALSTTPATLRDDYRRVTRRARRVTERLFYGLEDH